MGKTSAVIRLGYVHLRVTDLEEARNHYSNTLGMEVVHEEPGKLWLKCWDEWDHHSLMIEEGGVGLVKLGYKVETDDDLATFENRAQQFGTTTGRFSAGENLKVGDGLRLTLPSEQTIELYTEMEFTGTDTGSINPEAWPRNMRGVGTHWIDHALIPAEDPGLIERFMMEVLDFKPAERVVESMDHPELIGTWMSCGESPHDLAVIKGPNSKLHHFALPPGGLGRDPAGRRHLQHGRRADRHRPDPPWDHPRHDDLLLRPRGQPQRGVRRAGLPGARGLPDDQLDGRPAGQGNLLPRP